MCRGLDLDQLGSRLHKHFKDLCCFKEFMDSSQTVFCLVIFINPQAFLLLFIERWDKKDLNVYD